MSTICLPCPPYPSPLTPFAPFASTSGRRSEGCHNTPFIYVVTRGLHPHTQHPMPLENRLVGNSSPNNARRRGRSPAYIYICYSYIYICLNHVIQSNDAQSTLHAKPVQQQTQTRRTDDIQSGISVYPFKKSPDTTRETYSGENRERDWTALDETPKRSGSS